MTFLANAARAAFALSAALHGGAGLAAAAEPALIPDPAMLVRGSGEWQSDAGTAIVAGTRDAHASRIAAQLADLVQRTCGVRIPVRTSAGKGTVIQLARSTSAAMGPESYRLDVRPGRATISARGDSGLLYGAVTLWQLMCPREKAEGAIVVPAMRIDDAPRFAWRGLMLDSARHYQSPRFIRQFIDWMALHKLNVLHWHLTDDQAWRLEIRKYPLLTSVGAWRVPAGPAAQADIDAATGKPRLYGGAYSQSEVRALVAYAAARGVTIVPEIEMPGHASAAIAAYPMLAAAPQPVRAVPADWGIYPNVYNLDETTFGFLEDVLTEVMALFPGKYIHLGGDEVEKTQWKASAPVQARMKALGIREGSVQVYFTQRIGRFLQAKGRRLVGWDEILEPGLQPAAVVMSWRGIEGALAAAAKGHDTVLSPWPTLYFDNRQADVADPPGRKRIVSVEDVYRFEPMPGKLTAAQQRHVLGLQGNLWTEHIRTEERVAIMTWPRAAAIAELGWSAPAKRDWPDFQRRLAAQFARYDALQMPYAKNTLVPSPPFSTRPGLPMRRTSHELKLCTDNIALSLEDDAPVVGKRAIFLVDIMDPCWIAADVDLENLDGVVAAVGQVPFNFQIGEDIHKIVFPKPVAPEGELEVHLGDCKGPLIARLPVKPAMASQAVTELPRAPVAAHPGRSDVCVRFAQETLEPLWVLDWIEFTGRSP